jgi:hypothetical protein
VRDTCVFIAFLWLCDVASDIAKAGHPFWCAVVVLLLIWGGLTYLSEYADDGEDEEDGEVSLEIDTVQALIDSAIEGEPRQLVSVNANAFKRLVNEFESKTEETDED